MQPAAIIGASMNSNCGAIRESVVLVENDERGDDAGHPSTGREQKNDEDATTSAVEDGEWWK